MAERPDDGDVGARGDESPRTDHDRTLISPPRPAEASARRAATVVMLSGPEIGRHFPLRRSRVTLGRGEQADILLKDKEISRVHAAIEGIRMGSEAVYRLVDLESTNHVFVNGTRVERHLLVDGDKIRLGDIVLKFELHDAIDERFHTEIRNRIRYDDLTGLLTYESFRTALDWELQRYANAAKGCGVVMMDLDDFKRLNDTHGHLAGSFVLSEVGGIVRSNLRLFDVAARYGGEEFIAYLPETDREEAMTAAERLRATLAEHTFVHHAQSIRLTISMGVSHFPEDGRELEPLVQSADEHLYGAKRAGKNRVFGASPS